MASTITAATLSVTFTESITLGGVKRDSRQALAIPSIGEISNRIMSITNATNGTDIIAVGTTLGSGQYNKTSIKYIRITNLDDTNFIELQLTDESAHYVEFKIEAGKSFIMGDINFDNHADIDSTSLTNPTKIIGLADTAAVDIEVYIAST